MTTRRIVVGLDGSPGAAAALDWCIGHALALDAEIVAVHVVDVGPLYFGPATIAALQPKIDDVREAHGALLADWARALEGTGIPYRTRLADGRPAHTLDRVAADEDADLVVVGRRGRGGFAELLLGSTSHALTQHGRRAVVIVPAGPA